MNWKKYCNLNFFQNPCLSHKSTYSSRVLNFLSNHPISQRKEAMVLNFVDKALLMSDNEHPFDNLNYAFKILVANFYPINFIVKFINLRI